MLESKHEVDGGARSLPQTTHCDPVEQHPIHFTTQATSFTIR